MSVSKNSNWDTLLTTMLVVCALVTTGLVLYRQLFVGSMGPVSPVFPRAVFISDWRSQLAKGVTIGSLNARVKLIEFSDFDCPYCAGLHASLKPIMERYPGEISLSYIYFPIPIHRFAIYAARVAECANDQGHFSAMHDLLLEKQNLFGIKPWSEFAAEAGVPDIQSFESCIQRNDPMPRIVEGRKIGEQLDIKGTPTLLVNGWKLSHPPSSEELEQMVKRILSGKSPV